MRIGFTGTQRGMTPEQRNMVRRMLEARIPFELHHGDCIGADQEVATLASILEQRVVVHPPMKRDKRAYAIGPDDEVREPKDYRARNEDIVAESDVLIAAPKEFGEAQRSGTWMTIRIARRMGKPVIIVSPTGAVS